MAKKKSKKKPARKPVQRRTPWSDAFEAPIVTQVLSPILIRTVSRAPASSATSLAQIHSAFEAEHGCSIPRPLFDKVAAFSGISFSKGISFQQNVAPTPNLSAPRQTPDTTIGDRVRLTSIPTPTPNEEREPDDNSEPEGEDGFKITNDAVSPEAAANDEARRQALIDASIAEANGEIPEPVIIPRR
jgi:hypothetical protein